jgi:hypothetical protein
MRREDPTWDALPVSGNDERALPASRRTEHGAEDGGGNRAYPAGGDEARKILEAGQDEAGGIPGALAALP